MIFETNILDIVFVLGIGVCAGVLLAWIAGVVGVAENEARTKYLGLLFADTERLDFLSEKDFAEFEVVDVSPGRTRYFVRIGDKDYEGESYRQCIDSAKSECIISTTDKEEA
jgi:hypothetical protein